MTNPLNDPEISRKMNYYSRLKKLAVHMKSNAVHPLDLEQAAHIACMEKTSFSRFFKKAVGINFLLFMQQWRISIAIAQMLESDCSLTYIAASVGFDNLNTFERTFKKLTGYTPSQYRKLRLAGRRVSPKTTDSEGYIKAFSQTVAA